MKKLLLILLCFPLIGFGQDVPLTEKKVTTDKMEEKDRKLKKKKERKYNRSLAMKPKSQIGYITNWAVHPYGGVNFFYFPSEHIGFYCDWRPSLNSIHGNNFTGIGSYPGEYTVFNQTLWTSVTNFGVSFRINNSRSSAIMIYGGIGGANTKTYSGYYSNSFNEYWWVEDGGSIENTNYNFGILRQTDAGISWQVGFDTALLGINLGIGFTWD